MIHQHSVTGVCYDDEDDVEITYMHSQANSTVNITLLISVWAGLPRFISGCQIVFVQVTAF